MDLIILDSLLNKIERELDKDKDNKDLTHELKELTEEEIIKLTIPMV